MKEWDKLNIFYYVARAGSFSAAAKELNISQPSLSRAVALLEGRMKTKLFNRRASGVEMTREGLILYKHVSVVFSEIAAAVKFIDGKEDTAEGELKILTTHSAAYSWLCYLLPEFTKRYPDIKLVITGSDEKRDLNNFDVAILPFFPNRNDLIQRHVKTFHMRLFASQQYLDKYGIPQTPDDLSNHHLMTYGAGAPAPMGPLTWLTKEGHNHSSHIQINSSQGRLVLAKLGMGIAELGKEHPNAEDTELVEVLKNYEASTVEFYYIYPQIMQNSKRITCLGNYLEEFVKK